MTDRVDIEDLARLRIALTRIARMLERGTDLGDITRSQLWVLATIVSRGPLGLGELAEIEHVGPTVLSRIIGKLVDRGLVRRMPSPDDGRAARVEATRAGVRLHERRRLERTILLGELIDQLSDSEISEILGALPSLEALAASRPAAASRANS